LRIHYRALGTPRNDALVMGTFGGRHAHVDVERDVSGFMDALMPLASNLSRLL